MKMLFLILNWVFGSFFLLFSMGCIAAGYNLTAIPYFIVAAILLPPVRHWVNHKTNWEITAKRRRDAIVILIAVSMALVIVDGTRVIKKEKLEKEAAYAEMLKKQNDDLANEFNKNREAILSEARQSIGTQEYKRAIELSAKYVNVNNQELISLGEQAQEEHRKQIILQEENTILAQLKGTPETNYNKRLNLYVRLKVSDPDNKIYQTKAEYYANKIKTRDEKEAKEIQKINKQLEIKEEKQEAERQKMLTEIKHFCADKWEEDYEMQKYCRDKQNKAFKRMMETKERRKESELKGSSYGRILLNCMEKWKKSFNSYDWAMVEYCNKKQTDAYLETRD